MSKGNGHDRAAARAELARRLMQLAPRQRLDALIEGADAKGLVRSVPAEDLYLAIAEVGLPDAVEVVQLASSEQFRACVDLGAWRGHDLDPYQVLAWLRAARGEDGEEYLRKLRFLDLEVLELMLRSFTVIHDLEEDPDVNPPGVTMETPEGKYLIEFKVEGIEQVTVKALLSDLFAENPLETARLLEAIRWELVSELEETAHRFRAARLADLGFPELTETLGLFTFVDPAKFAPPPPVLKGPGKAIESRGRVDFVEAALRGLDAGEAAALGQELRYLVNSALVAEGAEPGDPAAVRRVGELSRDYLNLALEHLCAGDPSRAAEAVREHPAKKLFQLGFSLTLGLKHRVERMERAPGAKHDGAWWALANEAAALDALGRKRPMRVLKVEGTEPVPFSTRKEIADAQALLDRAERQRAIFAALVGPEPKAILERFGAPLARVGTDGLFLSAVCWAVLGDAPDPKPIAEGRLVELCERLFEGEPASPKLRASAIDRAALAISGRAPEPSRGEVRPMVERVLLKLLGEAAEAYLSQGRLDPKALSVLPIAGQAIL